MLRCHGNLGKPGCSLSLPGLTPGPARSWGFNFPQLKPSKHLATVPSMLPCEDPSLPPALASQPSTSPPSALRRYHSKSRRLPCGLKRYWKTGHDCRSAPVLLFGFGHELRLPTWQRSTSASSVSEAQAQRHARTLLLNSKHLLKLAGVKQPATGSAGKPGRQTGFLWRVWAFLHALGSGGQEVTKALEPFHNQARVLPKLAKHKASFRSFVRDSTIPIHSVPRDVRSAGSSCPHRRAALAPRLLTEVCGALEPSHRFLTVSIRFRCLSQRLDICTRGQAAQWLQPLYTSSFFEASDRCL